jgi:hypothetical protein
MIAPLRQPEKRPPAASETLRRARRAVAESLFPQPADKHPARVPVWRAWLLAAWMIVVAAAWAWLNVLNR